MSQEKSAGAVVFRKDSGQIYYLLLHYQPGHWDFPKGHIEKDEREEETVKREIEEETGLKGIEIIQGFKETVRYFFRLQERTIFKTVVFYLAETENKDIRISFEHTDYKWLVYEDAFKQATFKKTKEILKKAHDYIISKVTADQKFDIII